MGKIHLLDEHIANQIAAGEVVERPASVVKELVENAIDAGSAAIDVEIMEGGLQGIRVTDNGTGIDADDLETAFLRHATSKIASDRDLFRICSLGFRGEALPSIAAVARMECLSSASNEGLGRRIVIEGGTIKRVESAAFPRGTDIQVRDLFYNTPARLKYMKTTQTEFHHISDFMYRIALAHPDIAFTLKHNDNLLLQTLGNGELRQVIAAIYGAALARGMVPVSSTSLDYQLSGYISKPEITRANRSGMTIVINGRYIRNYALAQAILDAYHTLLPLHRFPLAVLQITMDPTLLDVNVHPSKLEVRFSKEPELVQLIRGELKKTLGGQTLIPEAVKKPARNGPIQEQLEFRRNEERAYAPPASAPAVFERRADYPSERELSSAEPDRGGRGDMRGEARGAASGETRGEAPGAARDETRGETRGGLRSGGASSGSEASGKSWNRAFHEALNEAMGEVPGRPSDGTRPTFPQLYPVGQVRGTYIVAQNEDGLFLIDQHAAHERINYEYYYELFGRPAEASQELLLPISLEVTPSEAEALKGKLVLLQQAGVILEHFGGSSFIVRSYPHWIPEGSEREIIEEMVEWVLSEAKQPDIAKIREKSAILCSCKASIKANDNLTRSEMEALLDKLSRARNPYTCPHGRPIVVSFSNYELEKMFKRA